MAPDSLEVTRIRHPYLVGYISLHLYAGETLRDSGP